MESFLVRAQEGQSGQCAHEIMPLEKEIRYGDVRVAVKVLDSKTEDGNTSVERIQIRTIGVENAAKGVKTREIDFGHMVPWEDVLKAIAAEHIRDILENDVSTDEWDFVIGDDSNKYDVLKYIVNNGPVISTNDLREVDFDFDYNPSTAVSHLLNDGLVEYVEANGTHVCTPTSVGVKEVYERGDIEEEDDGGASLFSDIDHGEEVTAE